jgi:hypothetical protein
MEDSAPEDPESKSRFEEELSRVCHEGDAISYYVQQKLAAGLVTPEQHEAVERAFVAITEDAGLPLSSPDAISIAVARHGVHAMRTKLLELFPEWRAEIDKIPKAGGRER